MKYKPTKLDNLILNVILVNIWIYIYLFLHVRLLRDDQLRNVFRSWIEYTLQRNSFLKHTSEVLIVMLSCIPDGCFEEAEIPRGSVYDGQLQTPYPDPSANCEGLLYRAIDPSLLHVTFSTISADTSIDLLPQYVINCSEIQ